MAGSARLDGRIGAVGSPPLWVPPPPSRTLRDGATALWCGPRTQLSSAHSQGPAAWGWQRLFWGDECPMADFKPDFWENWFCLLLPVWQGSSIYFFLPTKEPIFTNIEEQWRHRLGKESLVPVPAKTESCFLPDFLSQLFGVEGYLGLERWDQHPYFQGTDWAKQGLEKGLGFPFMAHTLSVAWSLRVKTQIGWFSRSDLIGFRKSSPWTGFLREFGTESPGHQWTLCIDWLLPVSLNTAFPLH